MPRRREENAAAAARSRSRDRAADVEPPQSEKRRKHRKAAAEDAGDAPVKRSSRRETLAEDDPYQMPADSLDIELDGKAAEKKEKKSSRKHPKATPARDVSIDSEDLRGADEPPARKAVEEPSTSAINYRDLYRKASKTLSKSKATTEADIDMELEAVEAQVAAKEKPKRKSGFSAKDADDEPQEKPKKKSGFSAKDADDDFDLAALEAQMIAKEQEKTKRKSGFSAKDADDDFDLAALEAQMVAKEQEKTKRKTGFSAKDADDDFDLDALEAQMVAKEQEKTKRKSGFSAKTADDDFDLAALEAQMIAKEKEKETQRSAPHEDESDFDPDEALEQQMAAEAPKGKRRRPAQRGSSEESESPEAAAPSRRSAFSAKTPAVSSQGSRVREASPPAAAPQRQQQLARQESQSYSDSGSEEQRPRHSRFFGTSTNASLPQELHGCDDPAVATGVKEALAGGLALESEPPAAQVGASGIDFSQVRQLREQEEEKAALAKVLEKTVLSSAKKAATGPADINLIKQQMEDDLEKTRRARDEAQKHAAEKAAQEEEYFKASLGTDMGPEDRFTIIEELGKGEFASVFRCKDKEVRSHTGEHVEYAVKITRNNEQLEAAMEREITMLGNICTQVATLDREGGRHILGLMFLNGFEHDGHLCCVYELMKCDLRMALTKYTQGAGFPLYPTVRSLGKQLLLALRALAACEILHCDVKPDNILLGLDRETIKLSDFGSALEDKERKRTEYLQPRHYRCPEIILGQTYSTQIDVWSAGCTIFELATGKPFFVGQTNNAMMHEYLKVCGPLSKHIATEGHFFKKHFTEEKCDFLNAAGDYTIDTTNPAVLPMSHFDPPKRPLKGLIGTIMKPPGVEPQRFEGLKTHLVTLLRKLCDMNPLERATPEEALHQKFFELGAR